MKKTLLSILALCLMSQLMFAQRIVTPEQLSYTKKNLSSIPNGERAQKSLLSRADKELKNSLTPVTDKKRVAPSGDKHDYISMGPYWWPDSSKPDGLPYVRRDGLRNPELKDFDRDKLGNMRKSVATLAYAYYYSDDERYAQKAIENLQIWFLNKDTRMNPHLNYGQMIPGRNNNMGRGTGLIDTYGLTEVVDCIAILSKSKHLKQADLDGLKKWFSDFVDWMTTSKVGLEEKNAKNNHGLAYDVQIAAYSLFSGKEQLARETINNFAKVRMFPQIEPDGSQPLELERTIALHYSIFNINHMLDMVALAKSEGVDLYSATSTDGRSIAKATDFLIQFVGMPESDFPYQQIKEWDQVQDKLCWLLRRTTFYKENKEYEKLFNKYSKTEPTSTNWLFLAR